MSNTDTKHYEIGDRVQVFRDGVFQYVGAVVMTRFDRGDLYRIKDDKFGTFCDSYGFELVAL